MSKNIVSIFQRTTPPTPECSVDACCSMTISSDRYNTPRSDHEFNGLGQQNDSSVILMKNMGASVKAIL